MGNKKKKWFLKLDTRVAINDVNCEKKKNEYSVVKTIKLNW